LRILAVHPGPTYSVHDVYMGVADAMLRTSHKIIKYESGNRIYWAGDYLLHIWKGQKRQGIERPKPNDMDFIYLASTGIIERALRFDVDWVFIVASAWTHPDVLGMLKNAGIRTAILFTESPYEDEAWQLERAKEVTACWTNERASVEAFRKRNPHSYYWQHALDPKRHRAEAPASAAAHDVVFVGTGFQERVELLSAVDWDGIDFGLYGAWETLGSRNRLRKHLRSGPIPNEVAAALYRAAKVGINIHRTSEGPTRDTVHVTNGESMGPRCYELAACGAFFITDYRAEVEEVFGDVIPTFADAQEMEDLIRYYLAHEDERKERAAALPALVAQHTFDNRVAAVFDVLEHIQEQDNGTV
jgi:spore maturation protein CgeB